MDELINEQDAIPVVIDRWEIDTVGLEEEILCEMCENPMHTDRGCDGLCSYDKDLYKRIIKVLNDRMKPLQPDVPDMNVGDMISRRAAIDALDCINGVEEVLRSLPSAEPTITHEQAIDYLHETGWLQSHDRILTEHEQMYKRAFSVACELLIGANLYGVTVETMFKEIMEKDGIVSSLGYERYILDNLARLTGED